MQYDNSTGIYYDDGQPDQSAQNFAVQPNQAQPASDFAVQSQAAPLMTMPTQVAPQGYDPYAPVEAGQPLPSYDELLAKYAADNAGSAGMPATLPGMANAGNQMSGAYGQEYAPSAAPAAAGAINPQMLAGLSSLVSALSGMTGNRTPSGGSTPGYGQQLPPRLVRP
jgi:hypothetical protein